MKTLSHISTLVLGIVLAFSLSSCNKVDMLTESLEFKDKENDALHIQLKFSVAKVSVNGVEYLFDCEDVHAVRVIEVPELKTYSIIKIKGEKVTASIHRKNWYVKDLGEIPTLHIPNSPHIKK